ncbi:type II secretion system minor pseudopilin GspJ [Gilvimarinus polysaccharolyticus]|uniref:type II secretion system minor pseudopilin GspJ n=1 Tax=Gilvimarinus polysaccharolyticus TaxID=863921 RepID=UPI000673B430|nr:type II secretion system minor pseudopilin GspJ [Gilvimarinus polysaccharolyticus]
MNKPSRQKGFTLVEVVVVVAITAVIMTFSFQSFSVASRSATASADVMARVNELDRTWQVLGQDLRNILNPVNASNDPNVAGGLLRPVRGASVYDNISAEQLVLQFTRANWLNPMNRPRSDLQQVIYRIKDGILWRDYRPERNLAIADWQFTEDMIQQKMLTGITKLELRFLSEQRAQQQDQGVLEGDDYARDWDESWPASGQSQLDTSTPLAVLITIELEDGLMSERLYDLAH